MSHAAEHGHYAYQRKRRVRLYPRGAQILKTLDSADACLVFDDREGKYHLNGSAERVATVIPRTLRPLLKMNALREAGGTRHLHLTEHGRRLVRDFYIFRDDRKRPLSAMAAHYARSLAPQINGERPPRETPLPYGARMAQPQVASQ